MEQAFNYETAFKRNLGWLSRDEQNRISKAVIAIPGMGGVGGHHVHSLARVGFQNFKIADFDQFELHNFNRQIGAKMSTLGRNKAQVMKELILQINPKAQVQVYSDGVNSSNAEDFLEGVDLVVDGLDLFVIKERIELFDRAIAQGIPVLTAGPIGMGTSAVTFRGHGVSFSKYCNINQSMSKKQLVSRFMSALVPWPMQARYVKMGYDVDFEAGRTPSLHSGVLAATAHVTTEAIKLILKRGRIRYAPFSIHYDFYLQKVARPWRPWGNRNPLQRILIFVFERWYWTQNSSN